MNANLYIQRKADYLLYEADLAKANDQLLIEISNELALGLSLEEMKNIQAYFKRKAEIQLIWNCKQSAKHGQNIAITKPSKEKSKSTAKKSTAYSKPTLQKPQKKSKRHGVLASLKITRAS